MMEQEAKGAPIDAAAAQGGPLDGAAGNPRKRDAPALWRAVAGMAVSLALACFIVMLEFTGEANHRAARIRRHADALLSRIARLESEVAAERARTVAAHRELVAAESLREVLRSPDAGMLQLAPPGLAAAATAAHKAPLAPAREGPAATLAFAPREHRAVLMVARLKPPAADTVFALWWSAPHGAPVRAAEFTTATDGSALVSVPLPAGLVPASAMITAGRAAKGGAPGAAGTAGGDGVKVAARPAAEHAAPPGPVVLRGGALAR